MSFNTNWGGRRKRLHLAVKRHSSRRLLQENTPDTDTESSLPTVGVVAALIELAEEMEEVLSARAKGAMGGGLAEWAGGLNGRF